MIGRVAITGIGIEAPANTMSELLGMEYLADWPFDPAAKLGKKGLRYKESSTLKALCAARTALIDSGRLTQDGGKLEDDQFGVAIASNTGNLETVCAVAETIRNEHVDATSAMDLPNASSNVIASTVAIRFGLRALNLMLTSGSNAAADALILAANAIRAGRVGSMLVGAVETDSIVLQSLRAGKRLATRLPPALTSIASAVILENESSAVKRNARIYGYFESHAFSGGEPASERFLRFLLQERRALNFLDPAQLVASVRGFTGNDLGMRSEVLDLNRSLGQLYGALATAQLVLACERFADRSADDALLVSGGVFGDRRLTALSATRV